MNHKHRKTLHALFAHPESANISRRSVEAVLGELGGEIEQRHGGRWGVRLKKHFVEFPHSDHSLPLEQVRKMRKFLTEAGIDPVQDYPL
jgi:hypothetical protein